jgi:hypothetical protein
MVDRALLTAWAGPLVIAVSVGLGACSTSGGKPVAGGAGGATGAALPSDFLRSSYCPPLEIRPGTESTTVYERGRENERAYVRYQASITRTARECTIAGTTLSMKIGVSGRVVAGPKGGAGAISLPIRIVVVKQISDRGPLYTQLFKTSVALAGPTFGADFSEVFDHVVVDLGQGDRDLVVFVGFDEGPK